MGGITIAHHQPTESEDNFTNTLKMDKANEEQLNQLLAGSGDWQEPMVEDLTGEAQDLMLRESIGSWLQPWTNEGGASCLADFNAQLYAQSIQLEDLFGQDELANFSPDILNNESNFYDEITFVPDDASLTMSAPTTSSSSSASSPADTTTYQVSPIVQSIQPFEDIVIEEEEKKEEEEQQIELVENNDYLTVLQQEEDESVQVEEEEVIVQTSLKRRRSSSSDDSSDSSSDDSSSEEESDSENETVIPTTVANMNSRISYSSSDSDSDSDSENVTTSTTKAVTTPVVSNYIYMHKRQVEEALLDKITNHLQPEKLPGILSILSTKQQQPDGDDEVEIDLSCLERELLVQLLSYVDACILEQNGGPTVRVEDYIMKKGPRTRPALQKKRAPKAPKARSRAELTEDLSIESSNDESSSDEESDQDTLQKQVSNGPMSMASLSKKSTTKPRRNAPQNKKATTAKRNRSNGGGRRRKNKDDSMVSSSVTVFQDPDSIASSRPKRRAALHKRRLLEKMLAPSDDDDDSDDEMAPTPTADVLVVFSDEQMDLRVVDNQTIVHTSSTNSSPLPISTSSIEEDEENDEEIDIMC